MLQSGLYWLLRLKKIERSMVLPEMIIIPIVIIQTCHHWEICKWVISRAKLLRPMKGRRSRPKAEMGLFLGRGSESPFHQLGLMIFYCFGHWKRPLSNKKCQPWINRLPCRFWVGKQVTQVLYLAGRSDNSMAALRHRQWGALGPSENVKCFVHCKTLSRRIIYALFSPVVGFWGLGSRVQTPSRAPSLPNTW